MGHLAGPKLGVGETGCWRRGEALRVHFAPARSRQAPHVTVCISADLWTTLPTGSSRSSAAVIALLFFPLLPLPFLLSPSSACFPSPRLRQGGSPAAAARGPHPNGFLEGEFLCVFFYLKTILFPSSLLVASRFSFLVARADQRKAVGTRGGGRRDRRGGFYALADLPAAVSCPIDGSSVPCHLCDSSRRFPLDVSAVNQTGNMGAGSAAASERLAKPLGGGTPGAHTGLCWGGWHRGSLSTRGELAAEPKQCSSPLTILPASVFFFFSFKKYYYYFSC